MAVIGTFGSFTAARLGIFASQAALNVTGNNIANINTAGYTRQRVDLVSLYSYGTIRYSNSFDMNIGYGVLTERVSQLRDPFLDIRFRDENSNAGAYSAKLGCLQELGYVLDEVGKGDGEFGIIAGQLEDFLMQLQNYNGKVGSEEYDTTARGSAETLTRLFNDYAKAMETLGENKLNKLKEDIGTVNDLLTEIRDLSAQIREGEIYGDTCLEMRDARNLRIDELSSYIKVNVTYDREKIDEFKSVERINISIADTKPPIKLIQGQYGAQIIMPETAAKRNPNFNSNDPASNYYISRESDFSDPTNPRIVYTNNLREAYGPPALTNTRAALEKLLSTQIRDSVEAKKKAALEERVRPEEENALKAQVKAELEQKGEVKAKLEEALKAELRKQLLEEKPELAGEENEAALDAEVQAALEEAEKGEAWQNDLEAALNKAVDAEMQTKARQKELETNVQAAMDAAMDDNWKAELAAEQQAELDKLTAKLNELEKNGTFFEPAKAPYWKSVQATDENGRLMYDGEGNPIMTEVGTWNADEAIQVQNATEENWEDNHLWMSVEPLVDNKGRYLKDQYHKDIKETVDLTDTVLYGSIQALREFLTEKGEFSSDDDLQFDPDAAQKRGLQYYKYSLDALARKFADSFNKANQLNIDDVNEAYELLKATLEDGTIATYFIGKDGEAIKDKDGNPITRDFFTDLTDDMQKLEQLKELLASGESVEAKMKKIRERMQELESQIEELEKKIDAGDEAYASIWEKRAQISELRNQIDESALENTLKDLRWKIVRDNLAKNSDKETLKAKVKEIEDKLAALGPNPSADELKAILGKDFTTDEIQEMTARAAELTAQIDANQQEINRLEKRQALYQEGSTSWKDIQKEIDRLTKERDEKLAEAGPLTARLTQIAENPEMTEKELQEKAEEIKGYLRQLRELEQNQANNKVTPEEKERIEGEIADLEAEIDDLWEIYYAGNDAYREKWNKEDELFDLSRRLENVDVEEIKQEIADLENKISENTTKAYEYMEILRKEGTLTDLWSFYKGGVLFSSNGDTNDPTGITAKNITISKSWSTHDVYILHTKVADGIEHSTSDDNILHMIAMMSEDMNYLPNEVKDDVMNGGTGRYFSGSFAERLADMNSVLGVETDTTGLLYNNYTTQTLSLENSRLSVSSVDLNDEATSMMMFQKSYAAACQLMTTLDSMLDKLINGTLR